MARQSTSCFRDADREGGKHTLRPSQRAFSCRETDATEVRKEVEMNQSMMKLATLAGAALALTCGVVNAESTYGYTATGAGTISATAKVNITVTTPKLILLRVGASGSAAEAVALTASLTSIPGGATSVTAGNSQASGWNDGVPTLTGATVAAITAAAWTNASGGGKVSSAVTSAFTNGLTAASITVASTTVSGAGLAHPGTDTGTSVETSFARNAVASSTWVYSIAGSALAGIAGGADTQVVTYTATAL